MRNILVSSTLAISTVVAAAFIVPQPALAQRDAPICLLSSESGAQNCSYQSITQCLESRSGATDTCALNPSIGGTVGYGGGGNGDFLLQESGAPLGNQQPRPTTR